MSVVVSNSQNALYLDVSSGGKKLVVNNTYPSCLSVDCGWVTNNIGAWDNRLNQVKIVWGKEGFFKHNELIT